jgi:hypothetical protein
MDFYNPEFRRFLQFVFLRDIPDTDIYIFGSLISGTFPTCGVALFLIKNENLALLKEE